MSAIKPNTREKIKAYLDLFIENLVNQHKERVIKIFDKPVEYLSSASSQGRLKPFHAAIIPSQILRISTFERSFSTTLGTTFEECAKLIALDHHQEAYRGHQLTGNISLSAVNEIEHQITRFERTADKSQALPALEEMIDAVFNAQRQDDLSIRSVVADLYIIAQDGTEYFFEMKSPMPNKGQCLEVTQRILRFHLVRNLNRPTVYGYFAMAYNPYGPTREDYRWSFAKSYMPFDQAVVIGQEFWTIVGGPTAYEELLEIYAEVGREKMKFMIDSLAFGF